MTLKEYADRLTKTPRRFGPEQVTHSALSLLEKARSFRYSHLERYANDTGYPSGLILLLSRLASDIRDETKAEDGQTAAAKVLLESIQEFTVAALRDLERIAQLRPDATDKDTVEFITDYRASNKDAKETKSASRERCALVAHALFNMFPQKGRDLIRFQARQRYAAKQSTKKKAAG